MTVARNQGWPLTAVRAVHENDARAIRMAMIGTSWPARFTEPLSATPANACPGAPPRRPSATAHQSQALADKDRSALSTGHSLNSNARDHTNMSDTCCASCQAELPEDMPGANRTPCPRCGSTVRSYSETLTDSIELHDGHRAIGKNTTLPSAKKLRFDTYSGVEHSYKYDKLVRVHRTVDKDKNWYGEKVIDPQTGETLHECEEPLSKHTGHGTAKPKNES